MGHKDGPWLPHQHGLTSAAPWASNPAAEHSTPHMGESEPLAGSPLADADDPGHWWTAWIDLGGEG
jgi:hypothetical protein